MLGFWIWIGLFWLCFINVSAKKRKETITFRLNGAKWLWPHKHHNQITWMALLNAILLRRLCIHTEWKRLLSTTNVSPSHTLHSISTRYSELIFRIKWKRYKIHARIQWPINTWSLRFFFFSRFVDNHIGVVLCPNDRFPINRSHKYSYKLLPENPFSIVRRLLLSKL